MTLPAEIELGEFSPVAYYDKHMDCIRVLTHDRSVTEHRIDDFFTVHECNHRQDFDPEYVGFTIKGIRALFGKAGISIDGVYRLTEIINRLVNHMPGSMMSETLKLIYRDYRQSGDLVVDMREAAFC